ncbi:MAG: divalent metal cation transporter [Halobacteria archaeon]|nr:divalent metal cation transporter [Halobacteria archaeon]
MSKSQDRGILGYVSDLGPTWLAGAIAAGPATMASLLTAGASFGYELLWIVVLSAVLGSVSQYLAMRLGLLTEEGIVSTVEKHLGEGWAWLLVVDAVLAAGLAQLVIMKTVADVSATVTDIDARIWGVAWAVILAAGLAGGGYRIAEVGAKILVSGVVIAFVASVFVVPVDLGSAAAGTVPRIPGGLSGAVTAAGVLGGAVHITLITMQSYTMRSHGWRRRDYGVATFDVVTSMLVAFGVYSLAIFVVAASVLHSPDINAADLTATSAARALEPIAGQNAKWLFLMGLWGAAVSTLGGNTVVPPYLVADKLDWEKDVSDLRYRLLLVFVAGISAVGAFLGGSFFPLLVLVLAFGLVGTPFALAIVLYLLNSDAVDTPNPTVLNLGGLVLIGVTFLTATSFVRQQLSGGLGDPLGVFVGLYTVVLTTAVLVLGAFAVEG